jgi:LEA14-like dessication related protein
MLVGCTIHGTQPRLRVEQVTLGRDEALVNVAIENEAAYDLTLNAIRYTLTVGPLPISEGEASFDRTLPAGRTTSIQVRAPIQNASLDPAAATALFTGDMRFDQDALSSSTTIRSTAFSAEGPVRRP